jgi:hypothetical protein
MPPEYEGGIEQAGVDALKAFVAKVGIIVTLNRASEFAIREFGAPARNARAGPTIPRPGSGGQKRSLRAFAAAAGMPTWDALFAKMSSKLGAVDATLETGGGVRIDRIAGPTELNSSDGGIFLTGVQAPLHASTRNGTITAWF